LVGVGVVTVNGPMAGAGVVGVDIWSSSGQ
jgi:hypothetical protein